MSGRFTEEQQTTSDPTPAFKQAEIQPRGNPPPTSGGNTDDARTAEKLEAGILEDAVPATKEKEAMSVFGLLKVVSYIEYNADERS